MRIFSALFSALVLTFAVLWLAVPWPARVHDDGRMGVANALGGDVDGFARAAGSRTFSFPVDHGPHPEYRTEWWYWTGNLRAADGRQFGYQFTVFRIGMRPQPVERTSAWATTQVAMAHAAFTDVAGARFRAEDRYARVALDLAGMRAQPFAVWCDDWRADGMAPTTLTFSIGKNADAVRLDLTLDEGKALILNGDGGLSRKSSAAGAASWYYSIPRMPTRGVVTLADGERVAVSGDSWMDREWSTSALAADQRGWDWFALQLADGRELMLYQLRTDAGADPNSSGTVIERDGSARHLPLSAFTLTPTAWWTSPHNGARYPAAWRVQVPSAGIDVRVRPLVADQELDLAVRYWEGAVAITAVDGADAGRGYVELTGYTAVPSAAVRAKP